LSAAARPSDVGARLRPYLRSGSPASDVRVAPATGCVTALAVSAPRRLALWRAMDYVSLTKPRVVLMILVTTAVAYHLGRAGRPDWVHVFHTLAATVTLVTAGLYLGVYAPLKRRTPLWQIPHARDRSTVPGGLRASGNPGAARGGSRGR
jgi:heme O synthase-like polyprenyltransferase